MCFHARVKVPPEIDVVPCVTRNVNVEAEHLQFSVGLHIQVVVQAGRKMYLHFILKNLFCRIMVVSNQDQKG